MSMLDAVQAIGQHTNMLPRERGVTLPLVELSPSRILVRRLYYLTRVDPKGSTLSAPQFVATYDYSAGRFISLEPIDFEPEDLPPPPWPFHRASFASPADIAPEYERIWQLYDLLIDAWRQPESRLDRRSMRPVAEEYLRYFKRHAETPLLAYYRNFSGEFLDFVRQLAGA